MSDRTPETEDWAELLRVDPAVIRRRVEFFESCAALYPEQPDLDRAARTGDPRSSWSVLAQRATMLRQAGQFELLVELERARSFLLESALTYVEVGVPYGYFLFTSFLSAYTQDRFVVRPGAWAEAIQRASDKEFPHGAEEEQPQAWGSGVPGRPLRDSAARHPVQRAYLCLAIAADARAASEYQQVLDDLSSPPRVTADIPIGPQGRPLAVYCRFASLLSQLRDQPWPRLDSIRWELDTILIEHAREFEASIVGAWSDTYHWRALRTPVEVVDLDLAALAALAEAVLTETNTGTLEPLRGRLGELSPLARMPIELGVRLKRSNPSGPGFFRDRPSVPGVSPPGASWTPELTRPEVVWVEQR
jgi:hypothetical protein